MPNRMLRDWTNSEKVDQLDANGERFFTRLIMIVDDYGRYYADERLLRAAMFPRKIDSIRDADISRWMAACQKAGLIVVYENSGKNYLQIIDFNQRLRQKREKFPAPDVGHMTVNCQTDDRHMSDNCQTIDGLNRREVEYEEEGNEKNARVKNEKWNDRPGKDEMEMELDPVKAGSVKELFAFSKRVNLNDKEVEMLWRIFKGQNFTGEKWYASKNEVYSHFINWSRMQDVPKDSPGREKQSLTTAAPKLTRV